MVSPKNVGRALRIVNTLIKALRSMGYDIRCGSETYAIIEGEPIKIRLREKLFRTVNDEKEYSWINYDYRPSNILCFKMGRWSGEAEWRDGRKSIEELLPKILANLIITGKKLKEERIQDEIRKKQEQEQERILQEMKKRQELLSFQILLKDAERWKRVGILRGFINAIEEILVKRGNIS